MVRDGVRPVYRAMVCLGCVALGGATGRRMLDTANAPVHPVLAALRAHPDAASPSTHPSRRVVIALLDGLTAREMRRLEARRAFGDGIAWAATLDVGTPSISRPVYHTLLTGVPQGFAGLGNNAHQGAARADTLAARARDAGASVSWALTAVPWLHDLAGDRTDSYDLGADAPQGWSRRPPTDLSVLHLVATDDAGHQHGAASPEYRAAADASAETVRALRRARPGAWWFVGADHGHRDVGGHGGPEPEVTRVRWIALCDDPGRAFVEVPGVHPVTRLAATFAAALGVPAPRHALGDALPGVATVPTVDPQRAVRRGAVDTAWRAHADDARARLVGRGALCALVALGLLAASVRRRGAGAIAEPLVGVTAWVACLARMWPVVSLSAIVTHEYFLAHTLGAMAAGAAATVALLRRRPIDATRAVLWSTAPAVSTWVITGGVLSTLAPSPVGSVLWPTTGLLPTAVCAVFALRGALSWATSRR